MKRFLIVILVTFTFYSCSLDDGGSNFSIETLAIKEAIVPAGFQFGESYTLVVTYDLPSGCHSFFDLFYQQDGTSRIVAVNAIIDRTPGVACTDNIIEAEHSFIVIVTQSEDYTFRFWKGKDNNGQDVFEDIVVPVK